MVGERDLGVDRRGAKNKLEGLVGCACWGLVDGDAPSAAAHLMHAVLFEDDNLAHRAKHGESRVKDVHRDVESHVFQRHQQHRRGAGTARHL